MNEQTKASRGVTGRVISNKMDKTITVLIERRLPHPVYRKYVRSSSKLHAHDENNECREGDTVVIEQSRPLSRTKSWRLVKVVERAK
ncbi:MAG: 30S ribosomal protein S17 [Gammaproteobacteria bacterium]|nr:30S ribosomal protein S17 [Gammaproteobacteria bacterium]